MVDALKEVAGRHGVSPARVALAWVLARPAVSSVIIAARKPENLEDNIKAVDLQLSEDDTKLLDSVLGPRHALPEVDGAPARRGGGSAAQGAAPRALRGRRAVEGPARHEVVGLSRAVEPGG